MDPVLAEVKQVENENGKFTYLKLPERPEGVPDKFWNPENGLNLTALNTGYTKLETGRSQFQDEIRRNLQQEFDGKLPKPPEQYVVPQLALDGAPDGFQFNAESDPLVTVLKQAGKQGNLTQEGFSALVNARAQAAAQEYKALGEQAVKLLGENASDRIGRVRARLSEVLGKEQGEVLAAAISHPGAVLAIEKLVGGGTPGAGGSGFSSALTEEQLRSKMNDPRYYDPVKRDAAYCREIQQGFDKLYEGQKHDGQPHFTSR